MKRVIAFLLLASMILAMAGCGDSGPKDVSGKYKLNTERNEAIISDVSEAVPVDGNARVYYQIFVGSFSDSDGDGIGDLRGIIERFDYLNDGEPNSGLSLGVEGIWLSPIFASPSYHKYDTTDYYTIDPQFGTMDDLRELVALCHSRGVQIILDLVINHTSTRHSWFQEFTAAHQLGDITSEYYDLYSHASAPVPGATYNTISGTSEYYECNFSGDMPELNFENELVRQKMVEVAKFYLDLGVDGFRFDAAKYIYYGEENRNYDFWVWYMNELRAIKSDIYTVAEVWDGDGVTFPYFASTNCFNFTMSQDAGQISQTAKGGDVDVLTTYMAHYLEQIHSYNPDAMPITFITNHDMDRAAGFLTVATGRAKVAANLTMLMPGSSFIYYGEEIGLKGSRGGSNTDANRRLAMLWGDGDTVENPVGTDYSSEQTNGTVADQLPDGNSLYNHYKRLIAIRKANPEIAYGTYQALSIPDTKAGGFLSTWEGSTVAVLHNTTESQVTIDLAQVTDVDLTRLEAVVGLGNATLEGTVLTLDGQTSVVLK